MKKKQALVEEQRREMESLALVRAAQDQKTASAEFTDMDAIKRKIEAGPLAMAKGLIKSAADLATGGTTDPAERMAICEKCPFMGKDKRCGKCGCFLPAKTRIAKSSCPVGLW